MTSILLAILFAAAHHATLTDAARIAAKQSIERARYAFVLGDKPPFDTQYPRSFFKEQLRQERDREAVLRRLYGISITTAMLAQEYDRIDKSTKAPEQWEAVKAAVHNDRKLIEEVVCRPLLVERALRAKFDFDQKIHAKAHEKARQARAEFLAGRTPARAVVRMLSRQANPAQSTEEMLQHAQTEAVVPRVIKPGAEREPSAPLPLDPEATALLEKELHQPGDVSTILEYRDHFEVYRLIDATPERWRVEAVDFPKEDFDSWYASVRQTSHSPR